MYEEKGVSSFQIKPILVNRRNQEGYLQATFFPFREDMNAKGELTMNTIFFASEAPKSFVSKSQVFKDLLCLDSICCDFHFENQIKDRHLLSLVEDTARIDDQELGFFCGRPAIPSDKQEGDVVLVCREVGFGSRDLTFQFFGI